MSVDDEKEQEADLLEFSFNPALICGKYTLIML